MNEFILGTSAVVPCRIVSSGASRCKRGRKETKARGRCHKINMHKKLRQNSTIPLFQIKRTPTRAAEARQLSPTKGSQEVPTDQSESLLPPNQIAWKEALSAHQEQGQLPCASEAVQQGQLAAQLRHLNSIATEAPSDHLEQQRPLRTSPGAQPDRLELQ